MKDRQKANHQARTPSCISWGTGEIATAKHLKEVDARQLLQHRLGQSWWGFPRGVDIPKSADIFFEKEGLRVAVSVCSEEPATNSWHMPFQPQVELQ
jgi:hypothetical protein